MSTPLISFHYELYLQAQSEKTQLFHKLLPICEYSFICEIEIGGILGTFQYISSGDFS